MSIQEIIVAVGFALMGIGAFVRPRTFTAWFGMTAETPDARNEIQAVYGGFGIAVALVMLATRWFPEYEAGVLLAVAASLAGMALGRVVAAVRERPGRWPVIFFVVEAGGAILLWTALQR